MCRGINVVGDYKGQFIELGKKLREEAKKKHKKICFICGKEYVGYGNNAHPVMEGRCCDRCNYEKVIPMRIGSPIFKKYEVGMKVHILKMEGEVNYTDKIGTITLIDDAGQLHGTWGGCALIPFVDEFEIIEDENN